jgi:single-stranded-DNA-specific exonuclease
MKKRWNIAPAAAQRTAALQQALGINATLCRILAGRGIDNFDAAKNFFRPQLAHLHSPWLMKDMEKAVARLLLAFDRQEKILVFGDYDVDGTTSVAMLYQFLCSVYNPALLDFYVPHRYREGYGVSKLGIDFAKENGFSLVVSLDCGIKSADLVAYAGTLGIDFIICDHHLPDAVLPQAAAILNPKQADCGYPYKELCGCGVGFKLITALAEKLGRPVTDCYRYLDQVATAIAADIVPITGENRILAWYGLERINQQPAPGIRALVELGGVKGTISINSVVFVIAPRVNAAGRMDDARKAVQLFIEPAYPQALALAELLHSDNTDRKEADTSITEEALAIIAADPALAARKTTVVYREHWHKGVVGIVASRLIEQHYRPTVVLTRSGDVVAGSARSVPGFNLYEAVHACRGHLLGYGGHFAAAGLSMLPSQVEAFSQCFEEVVAATIPPELLVPEIKIDAAVAFSEITPNFYNIICQMEPFGPDNMRPVFVARSLSDTGYSKVVKELHLRLVVRQGDVTFSGIGFNMAGHLALVQSGRPFDLVFTIDENEWNGTKSLQLKAIDLRPSEV